jgi:hypothetical protein
MLLRYGSLAACVALAWTAGLIGCATPPAVSGQVKLPGAYEDSGLRITPTHLMYQRGLGYVGVAGIAQNIGDRDLKICTVTLDVLDVLGFKVCDASAFTTGLRKGQSWRFQALFTAPYSVDFNCIQPGRVTALGAFEDMLADSQKQAEELMRQAQIEAGIRAVETSAHKRKIGIVIIDGSNRVDAIVPGGRAEMAGWRVGDVVVAVDGEPVSRLVEIASKTEAGGVSKTYTIARGAASFESTIEFK